MDLHMNKLQARPDYYNHYELYTKNLILFIQNQKFIKIQ